MAAEIDDQILQDLYTWIDEIPFSRPKKNITRDFSDGVMMAELVKYYFPQLVDLHNYAGAQAASQKKKNWHLLNWRVFKKLNFELSGEVVDSLANCKPGTVERVLLLIRTKIDRSLFEQKRQEEAAKGRGANDQMSMNSPHQNTKFFKFSEKTLSNDAVSNTSRNRYSNAPLSKSATSASQDAVPRVLYEERVQECLSREEMISVLQAKIRKMEHLLHLKDVRIEELSRQTENVRPAARGSGPKAAGRAGGGGGGGGGGGSGPVSAPPMMNQQSQFPNQPPFSPAQLQQFQMQMGPNGQMPMMPPNGQMQMGPPNGQMQMGPPNGQMQMGPPNGQMQMGPPNGQMQMGPPNGQMQMGPPNGQMQRGPPNGQMQRGAPNGQMQMGPPPGMPFGMPPGMGGKGQSNPNAYSGSQYNQYNQGFPSYMPLPPIPQPQDGESNPQTPQNDDTMYSRD